MYIPTRNDKVLVAIMLNMLSGLVVIPANLLRHQRPTKGEGIFLSKIVLFLNISQVSRF